MSYHRRGQGEEHGKKNFGHLPDSSLVRQKGLLFRWFAAGVRFLALLVPRYEDYFSCYFDTTRCVVIPYLLAYNIASKEYE